MGYEIKNTAASHAVNTEKFLKLCEWLDSQLETTIYQTDPVNHGDRKFIRVFIAEALTHDSDYDLILKVADYFKEHGGWDYSSRYGDELRFFIS